MWSFCHMHLALHQHRQSPAYRAPGRRCNTTDRAVDKRAPRAGVSATPAPRRRYRARVIAGASIFAALALAAPAPAAAGPETPTVVMPRQALAPEQIAIIVNDRDRASRRIARYYQEKRQIPAENVVRIRFQPQGSRMDPDTFQTLYAQVQAATPEGVQAYALTWTAPYRVGCMAITTAFAAGYDEAFCARGCQPTRASPYFASASHQPYTDLGWRPTMSLAGADIRAVKALIDRGAAADGSRPQGTGYLVRTSDKARNVRAAGFDLAIERLGNAVRLARVEADQIEGKRDVLFYFTGLARVPKIATNRYLPGAVADHLTSTGGQLTDSRQMSSLRWLEAGATGSYGTVVEPCNLLSKFPDPAVLIGAYVSGATLIEAYWKSVKMPGQGIFIGEPLARPFGGYTLRREGGDWLFETYALPPGAYTLEAALDPVGPYAALRHVGKPDFAPLQLRLPSRDSGGYRVVPAPRTDQPRPQQRAMPSGG